MISVSKNTQIYNNTLEAQFPGHHLLPQLRLAGLGPTNFDLTNNTAHDNTIIVGTQSGAFGEQLQLSRLCTATQVAPYLNGSKNLTFSRNTYRVPSLTWSVLVLGRLASIGLSGRPSGRMSTGTVSQ